jgi:uracil phosphoribosyltransferase
MSVTVLEQPIAADALTHLRDESTGPAQFRIHLDRLSHILAIRATMGLPTANTRITTPLAAMDSPVIDDRFALVPVMRAGHGMLSAFQGFLPDALVWHVSMRRQHEPPFGPIFTDSKVPDAIPGSVHTCFVLDPMLATAGSACFTVQHLKDRGASQIVFVGVLGCTQGVERMQSEHPDVNIVIGAIDPTLNEQAYIVPGLGDAGDRLYPTA